MSQSVKAEKASITTHMFRQVGRFSERSIAVGTLEGLVTIMCTLVNGEGPRDGERFPASRIITDIGS